MTSNVQSCAGAIAQTAARATTSPRRLSNGVICLISMLYGGLIGLAVADWSYDYDALIISIQYYRTYGFEQSIDLLTNNTVALVLWDKLFSAWSPEVSLNALYGFSASIRAFIFLRLGGIAFGGPALLATFVIDDLNVSRFSLALSGLIWAQIFLKRPYAGLLFIPLHIFSPMAFFILQKWRYRVVIVAIVSLAISLLPQFFTRHFHDAGVPTPGNTYLYALLFVLLITIYRTAVRGYIFNFFVLYYLLLLIAILPIPFDAQYYMRFTYLSFSMALVFVLVSHYNGLNPQGTLRYYAYLAVCFLSMIYSLVTLGGNVWRFF